MRVRLSCALVLLALVGTACQSETPPVVEEEAADQAAPAEDEPTEEPEPEPEEEPEPEPAADEAALAYFEAFAQSRPASLLEMIDHAAEGSPAQVYAMFQHAFTEAQQQEGWPVEPQEFTVTDEGVELCDSMGFEPECTNFTDLVVRDGKMANFVVNGEPIEDRLFAGGDATEAGGVTADLVAAYHTVTGDSLIVILDVTNGSDELINLSIYSAEYLTSDNRQVSASDAVGPIELRAGGSAYTALIFPSQGVGGTVYLPGSSDDFMTSLEWEVPLQEIEVADADDLSQAAE